MKSFQRNLFTLVLSILSFCSLADTTDILFIGNSYTYFNNMPSLLQQVALSAGDTVYTESQTPGGRRISQHASDPAVFAKIRSRDWDYVVIQCQSQELSFPDGQVATDVLPFAQQICDSIRAINTCTIPMFFMTWGRKNGDASNCAFFPPLCTYEGMDSVLRSNYLKMGELNEAEVAGVGAVWRELRTTTPSLELYSPDESHPSYAGSLTAAYAFYSTVFRKNAAESSFNGSVTAEVADSIRSVVDRVITLNQDLYNIGVNDPNANFTINRNGRTVSPLPESSMMDEYRWNFGDGGKSSEENPAYTYDNLDTEWIITLSVKKNCSWTEYSDTVRIGVGILEQDLKAKKIYPNPSNGNFRIEGNAQLVSIFSINGKEIEFTQLGDLYSVDSNVSGLIILTLKEGDIRFYQKVMME